MNNKHQADMGTKVIVLTSSFASKTRKDQQDNLVQVRMVVDILCGLGFEVSIISATLDMESLSRQLSMLKPDLVFNLVEEIQGKGAFIHLPLAVLEDMNIPCTGNSHSAMVMASSKLLAKSIMQAHDILTPPWLSSPFHAGSRTMQGRYIIKSVWEHGSLGLGKTSVVKGFCQEKITKKIIKLKQKFGGEWFVESFIPGRELNVSILEIGQAPVILPVAEITFGELPQGMPEIVDYQAKWDQGSITAGATARHFISGAGDEDLVVRAKNIALKCWEVFDLSGYARVDFRVDRDNTLFVLEVNTNPCLSPDAGFMAAADKAEMSPVQVINSIVQAGLERHKQ